MVFLYLKRLLNITMVVVTSREQEINFGFKVFQEKHANVQIFIKTTYSTKPVNERREEKNILQTTICFN